MKYLENKPFSTPANNDAFRSNWDAVFGEPAHEDPHPEGLIESIFEIAVKIRKYGGKPNEARLNGLDFVALLIHLDADPGVTDFLMHSPAGTLHVFPDNGFPPGHVWVGTSGQAIASLR